ncbi:MAG: PKD domain-containing protein [Arenicella sp.]
MSKHKIIVVVYSVLIVLSLNAYAQSDLNHSMVPIVNFILEDDDTYDPTTFILNRSTGVAPLAVHFDVDVSGDAFHNRHYQWSFGDTTNDVWVVNGKSKNTDTGPITAHVYENPGTYTVTLRIIDENGVEKQQQQTIVVTDPEEIYAGANTSCVSNSTDFTGCPVGAQRVTIPATDAFPALYNLMSSNQRVLLKRGDQWKVSSRPILSSTNLQVGAFGTCLAPDDRGLCANAPLLINQNIFRTIFYFNENSSNNVVQHIRTSAASADIRGSFGSNGTKNLLIHKVKSSVAGGLGGGHVDGVFLSDSDFSGGAYTVYLSGKRIVLLGSDIYDNSSNNGHVIRFPIINHSVLSHNRISGAIRNGQNQIKMHGLRDSARQQYIDDGIEVVDTEYVHIANNLFGRGGASLVALAPQNASYNEPLSHIIFEKNRYDYTYGSPLPSSWGNLLYIHAQNVTVRNNIFDTSYTPSDTGPRAIDVVQRSHSPASANIKIYNNTFNASQNDYTFGYIGIRVCASCSADVVNNLIVRPAGNDPQDQGVVDQSGNATIRHNLFINNPDFLDTSSTTPRLRDYRIRASSPAKGTGGVVPVTDYYNDKLRGENLDVGATGTH